MVRTRSMVERGCVVSALTRWLTALLVAVATLTIWPAARADTRYGTSFESPEFTTGALDGQVPAWTGDPEVTVVASQAQGGSQSLLLSVPAAGANPRARFSLPTPFDAETGQTPAFRVRGYFRIDQPKTGAVIVSGLYDSQGFLLGALYAVDGGYQLDEGIGSAPAAVAVVANSWTAFELEADFLTRTITARIDGVLAATEKMQWPATNLGRVEFFGFNVGTPYSAWLDDLTVTPVARPLLATSFESPEFTDGDLDGQSGWNASGAVVQSSVASSGSRALGITLGGGDGFIAGTRALTFDPSTAPSPILRLRADFFTDLADSPQVSVLGLGGSEGFLGQFVASGGSYSLGTGLGTAPAAVPVVANRWTRIDVELDFRLQRITARVDGRLAATGDFESPNKALAGVFFGAYGGADYSVYLDGFSAVVAPPPVYLTGFESPGFDEGALDGQGPWSGTTNAEIQSEVVAHGSQALRVSPAGEGPDENGFALVSFDPAEYGSGVLRFSGDFWTDDEAPPLVSCPALYGSGEEFIGQVQDYLGTFYLGEGQGRATALPSADPDRWHHVEMDLDFAARTLVARVDDHLTGTADFANSASALGGLDFYAFGGGNGYSAVLDDVSFVPLEYPAGPAVSAIALPDWTVGQSYEATPYAQLDATGGTAPLTFSIASGALPPGMSLSSDGRLLGGPDVFGNYSFDVQVEDGFGFRDVRSATFHVNFFPTILTFELPPAAVGRPYSARLEAADGTPPYVWLAGVPGLPEGLSVGASSGTVTGTPSAPQGGSLPLTLQDAAGSIALASPQFDVADAVDLSKRSSRVSRTVTAEDPRREVRFLELTGGTVLDVLVSGRFSSADPPSLRLLGGDGFPFELTGQLFVSRAGARLKRFVVPGTGRYFLETTVPGGFAGRVTTRVVITPPRRLTGTVTIGAPGQTVLVPFSAPPGTRLASVVVRAPRGSAALPGIASFVGADGGDLVPTGSLTEGARARFRTLATLDSIEYALGITGRDGSTGELSYVVSLRLPRRFEFSLPDLPAGRPQ